EMPLPPYIRRPSGPADRERYQMVFARERGAVAAPTAGLHFTPALIDALQARGIRIAPITLHVGPGTFLPVRTERVEDHRMHRERYFVPDETARELDRAETVIAVGTTALRTLEASGGRPGPGATELFVKPVGTVASVRAIAPDDLRRVGAQIVLGNTYHLLLRPGPEVVAQMGGLHRFMSWEGNLLTDSGGFQVYSLAEQRKISEAGAVFRSHLDGSRQELTPERATEIQLQLGSDILMALDECPPSQSPRAYHEEALGRPTRWAIRCQTVWLREDPEPEHALH